MPPPSEIRGSEDGVPRAWIHIGIGAEARASACARMICGKAGSSGGSRSGCGSVRGRVSQWFGRGSRRVGCVHLVARLAHWTRAAEGRPRVRGPALLLPLCSPLGGSPLDGLLAPAHFLAGALRAVALRAGAFLAAARAGAFLAATGAADLPADATAASLVGYAPFTNLGAVAGARTASLNAFTGVMRAFLEALIRIASPVAGFRPMRAARFTLTNLAKPGMETGSPFETTAVTTSVNPSMTEITVFSSTSAWTATAFASSLLFMAPIMADARPVMHIFPGTNADICARTCSDITRNRQIRGRSWPATGDGTGVCAPSAPSTGPSRDRRRRASP